MAFAFGLPPRRRASRLNALLMSLVVYAGASQFVAVGLLAASASPLSIVLSTFVVNLRHVLMSSALAPSAGSWRRWQRAAFAFQLTDETFAVHALKAAAAALDPTEAIVLNATVQASWVAGDGPGPRCRRSDRRRGRHRTRLRPACALCRLAGTANQRGHTDHRHTAVRRAGHRAAEGRLESLARHRRRGDRGYRGGCSGAMDQTQITLTILGMGLVTYLPRLLPIWLLSARRLPPALVAWLSTCRWPCSQPCSSPRCSPRRGFCSAAPPASISGPASQRGGWPGRRAALPRPSWSASPRWP